MVGKNCPKCGKFMVANPIHETIDDECFPVWIGTDYQCPRDGASIFVSRAEPPTAGVAEPSGPPATAPESD